MVENSKTDVPDKKQTQEEYQLIFAAFLRLINSYENSAEKWEVMEDIINLRASFLIDRILTGLRMDFDRALEIIKNHNNFTSELERRQRDVLLAGIDNLVDFAAAEEYRMMEELTGLPDFDTAEIYEPVFEKYNLIYAGVENGDVLHAATIAAWWITLENETFVTFMTQGDERVRAWHLSHEGISCPKRDFPPELIPPIEFGCRCFLITDSYSSVSGALNKKELKNNINPVFKESLATGGRIFSEEHPYFKRPLPIEIKNIAARIKVKLHIV
ncbi:MAG: hypothetical protein EZS26_001024 [Candidatus Ordinivivax streblomastigis]|uniref:Phage head morphogenesis domain-containing protein n=1 Tax=Candidatus Ordinivivax streblomastigis TaxID=2540710 RepID=A0A5M8P383_9BACT|nr:MAG: hypothetical protein EZS26_001024 [Candidatus Ordinivivax streblomastigis]